jgi:integrase
MVPRPISTAVRLAGPYHDAKGWKVSVTQNGERKWLRCHGCTTEAQALDSLAGMRARLEAPEVKTVTATVDAYTESVAVNNSAASATFEAAALASLVRLSGSLNANRLDVRHIEAAIAEMTKSPTRFGTAPSLATQRSYAKAVLRFCAYLKRRGLHPRDVGQDWQEMRARRDTPLPWATKTGVKALGRGKDQLRNESEARTYLDAALELTAAYNTPEAVFDAVSAERRVAACLPLLCGLRSGEVLHLRVGDIDLGSATGYIRDGATFGDWHVKTASATRTFQIPPVLRQDLVLLTNGQVADKYLMRDRLGTGDNTPHTKGWLNDLVHHVCDIARVGLGSSATPVKIVTAQGLRGTYASLLRVALEMHVGDIATALGHADAGRTATRHYIGAAEKAPVLRLISENNCDTKCDTTPEEKIAR